MSRTRRIFAGFGVGLVNQILAGVVGLWVTRFTLGRIGKHDYGLWIVGGQFVAYLMLLDLGVTAILPREVALVTGKPIPPEERDAELREVMGRGVSLVTLLMPLLLIGAGVVFVILPADWEPLRGPLVVSLGTFLLTYPLRLAHSALTGLQELAYAGVVQTVSWVANVVVTVVLVLLGFHLYAVAIGPAVAQVISSVGWTWRLWSRHRNVLPRTVRWFDVSAFKKHIGPGIWVSLNQIAHLMLNATDVMVIGKLRGPEAVLPYSFTDKSETLLNNQPYAIANLAGPAMSELKASGDPDRLARAANALSGVVLAVSGAIVVGILAVNQSFVRVWVGEQYFGGMVLTGVLLANMIVRHWVFCYAVTLFYCGHERVTTTVQVVDGVVSLGLSIVLVRWLGIVGAPLAALISVLVIQAPVNLWWLAKTSGRSVPHLVSAVVPWFARFAPLVAAAIATGLYLGPGSLLGVAGVGAVVGLAYAGLMLPILRRPPLDVYAAPVLARFQRLVARFRPAPTSDA
jgi:O-antigen/teichoic acid export membrane protein